MSRAVYPITEFAEMHKGRDWVALDVHDSPTGKQYRLDLTFNEFLGPSTSLCQLIGYGRSYVERSDGKVRLTLAGKDHEGDKDFVILATPEAADQLIGEFDRRFRNMRRRIRRSEKSGRETAA